MSNLFKWLHLVWKFLFSSQSQQAKFEIIYFIFFSSFNCFRSYLASKSENMSECDLLAEFLWRHRVNARHDVTFCYGLHSTATPFTCNGNRSQHGDRDCRSASRRHHGREQTTVSTSSLVNIDTVLLQTSLDAHNKLRKIHTYKTAVILDGN